LDKERNFLSKALAAFTIIRMTGCTPHVAANTIIDGSNDCGIDAIFLKKMIQVCI
jgi:hypothetical protein